MSTAAGYQWSSDPKRQASIAITRAQIDLDQALREIERLPAMDLRSMAVAVHALSSFITVTGAVVDLLTPRLRDHPDQQIAIWLDGLAHATVLMSHTVSEVMNTSVAVPTTLRLEDCGLSRLIERACAYHRRTAAQKSVEIVLSVDPDLPMVRTDRVLVAAVLDTLLSNAVQRAGPQGRVIVDVRLEPEWVVCSVRDPGVVADSMDYSLAAAGRFVKQLGGQITHIRTPGQGTTIVFRLPGIPSE